MTAPHSTTSSEDTTRKIDLNLTQVAAAALAAVTAAVVGSRLGAVGTLIGAAGASVITTVATAVYRASLERSQARVRSLARRPRPLPTSHEGSGAERSRPAVANAPLGDEQLTGSADHGSQPRHRSRKFVTLRWGAVIVGAISAFVLAMMIITGFEAISGETVSGDEGTTVGRVVDAPPQLRNPAVPPALPSSSEPVSVTPTETTDAPTSTPDSGTSVVQSPTTTSGTSPSSEPIPPLIPTRLPGASG